MLPRFVIGPTFQGDPGWATISHQSIRHESRITVSHREGPGSTPQGIPGYDSVGENLQALELPNVIEICNSRSISVPQKRLLRQPDRDSGCERSDERRQSNVDRGELCSHVLSLWQVAIRALRALEQGHLKYFCKMKSATTSQQLDLFPAAETVSDNQGVFICFSNGRE
jgi:hypothetical protein